MTTTRTSTRPTSIPTSRPAARKLAADGAKAAVHGAVVALTKEYEQFLRSPASEVRASCNYFADHPNSEVTPDALLSALPTIGGGGDARVAAYVRWQLLSGLPQRPDDAMVRQLLTAYRASPGPFLRPGISQDDQQKLDQIVLGMRQEDETSLKEKLDNAVNAARRDNQPLLAYRDELYRRLPKTPETFAVALDDLLQRASAVAEDKDLLKSFCGDVRSWVTTSSSEAMSPAALSAMAKAVRRLADTKGPQYYEAPYWRERANLFAWRKTRGTVDSGHALKDLAVFLEEQSRQPPTDLTVKAKPAKTRE